MNIAQVDRINRATSALSCLMVTFENQQGRSIVALARNEIAET